MIRIKAARHHACVDPWGQEAHVPASHADILAVLAEGHDLALATTFSDGAPHVVTVSYASEGLTLYGSGDFDRGQGGRTRAEGW